MIGITVISVQCYCPEEFIYMCLRKVEHKTVEILVSLCLSSLTVLPGGEWVVAYLKQTYTSKKSIG